jgi:hypothetical protein
MRDALHAKYFILMLLLMFTGLYYLAATLVFPAEPDKTSDFDVHFWGNKRLMSQQCLS